jgi:hypothetical protein
VEDTFPDIGSMIEQDLKALNSGDDVQKLTDILLGKVPDTDEAR